MEKKAYWIGLQQAPGIGSRKAKYMLDYFKDVELVWNASEKEMKNITNLSVNSIANFIKYRTTVNLEKLYKTVLDSGCWIITIEDANYPTLLKEIADPPIVIYGKGNKDILKENSFAIVGTRKPSYYAEQMTHKISGDLAKDYVVVSGMARGIDTAAHKGCLKNQGNTIAVLGSGVNEIYPRENEVLSKQIIEKGCIISEYLPNSKPIPSNFPARNRIISGLSLGVLVAEAAEKSGALITADLAMEQGRDVFALPGLVTNPNVRGTHNLIKQGAKLVESAADIVEEYYPERLFSDFFGKSKKENNILIDITKCEKEMFTLIEKEPLHIDNICLLSNKSIEDVNAILLQLELKGLIKQLPGKIYTYKSD